ncbi:MAG: hypothetical protein ACPGR8_06275 [Limisphaerales bacterium]
MSESLGSSEYYEGEEESSVGDYDADNMELLTGIVNAIDDAMQTMGYVMIEEHDVFIDNLAALLFDAYTDGDYIV